MDTFTDILSQVFVDKTTLRRRKTNMNKDNLDDTTLTVPPNTFTGYDNQETTSCHVAVISKDNSLPLFDINNSDINNRSIIIICEDSNKCRELLETLFHKFDSETIRAMLDTHDRDVVKQIILDNPHLRVNCIKTFPSVEETIIDADGGRVLLDYDFITNDMLKLLLRKEIRYCVLCFRFTESIHIIRALLKDPIVFIHNDETIDTFTKIIKPMSETLSVQQCSDSRHPFFVITPESQAYSFVSHAQK